MIYAMKEMTNWAWSLFLETFLKIATTVRFVFWKGKKLQKQEKQIRSKNILFLFK